MLQGVVESCDSIFRVFLESNVSGISTCCLGAQKWLRGL